MQSHCDGTHMGGNRSPATRLRLIPLPHFPWKRCDAVKTPKTGADSLHSRGDDVVPFQDSLNLMSESRLPQMALVEVGRDHRAADPEPLEALVRSMEGCKEPA